jgi:hypothetical protein
MFFSHNKTNTHSVTLITIIKQVDVEQIPQTKVDIPLLEGNYPKADLLLPVNPIICIFRCCYSYALSNS